MKTVEVTGRYAYRPNQRHKRVVLFLPGIYCNVIEAAACAIVQAGKGSIVSDQDNATDARHAFKPRRKG